MIIIRILLISVALCAFTKAQNIPTKIGVVNFSTCITESKYGKEEQKNLENIKNQWSSLIEESQKELKDVSKKLENQEYLEGISPEAEEDLRLKYQTLMSDLSKYQNQLYQIMNQAQYFFIQKMSSHITKASEAFSKEKNYSLILNKEASFYNDTSMEITPQIIKTLDKNHSMEAKNEAKKTKKTAKK